MLTKRTDEASAMAGSVRHLSDWAEFTGEELSDGVEELFDGVEEGTDSHERDRR